jgi:hypothetical protein
MEMDKTELIEWGLSIVKVAAGSVALDESAEEWFRSHFAPSAERLEGRHGVFQRFSARLAEHLDRLGECAAIGALVTGSEAVTGELMAGALKAVGERYGTLTSLCDPR